jgi:hypothetical protein
MSVLRIVLPEVVKEGMRLGRDVVHDELSFLYPAPMAAKLKTTRHEHVGLPLDQGDLGSCTGNATVGMKNCRFFSNGTVYTEDDAVRIYSGATKLDKFKGSYPPKDTGSSGLAAVKFATKQEHWYAGYTHCFGLKHTLRTLTLQPCITGVNWYEGFDEPDSNGLVKISGADRGGHEFLLIGLDVENHHVYAMNSWGPSFGEIGVFHMSFDDFDRLLDENGDVTTGIKLK